MCATRADKLARFHRTECWWTIKKRPFSASPEKAGTRTFRPEDLRTRSHKGFYGGSARAERRANVGSTPCRTECARSLPYIRVLCPKAKNTHQITITRRRLSNPAAKSAPPAGRYRRETQVLPTLRQTGTGHCRNKRQLQHEIQHKTDRDRAQNRNRNIALRIFHFTREHQAILETGKCKCNPADRERRKNLLPIGLSG